MEVKTKMSDEKSRDLWLEIAELHDLMAVKIRQAMGEKQQAKPNPANALTWITRTKQDGSGTFEVCLKDEYGLKPQYQELADMVQKSGKPTLFLQGKVYWVFPSGDLGRKIPQKK
jgi:hypothetical protein